MSAGRRTYLKREASGMEIMNQLKSISASNTADVTGRSCAVSPCVRLINSPKAQMMVRPAYTIEYRAGDDLAPHAALSMCNEGDVIVISSEEDDTRALVGEVMVTYLRYTRKVVGIVLDGPIRDIGEIGKWNFPVYCTGTTPGGLYKEGPGKVSVSIACGEISMNSGGIVLADPDGVIAIPRKDAAVILEEARKFQATDEAKLEVSKNNTARREWVDKVLEAKGFEIIDDIYRP